MIRFPLEYWCLIMVEITIRQKFEKLFCVYDILFEPEEVLLITKFNEETNTYEDELVQMAWKMFQKDGKQHQEIDLFRHRD